MFDTSIGTRPNSGAAMTGADVRVRTVIKRFLGFIALSVAIFALAAVAFATSAFAVGIMPSFANVPTGWTTDRYDPASFTNVGPFQGRPASLGISINSTGDSANRPGGQQGSFYNTQGRQFSFSPFAGPGSVLSSDLYVPASWAIAANGSRRTDMWGVTVDAGNAISSYPIIGFTNYGGVPRFRVWDDSGAGVWIDLGATVNYDAWNHFSIELLADTSFKFYVNGVLVYTQTNTGSSVAFSAVVMQAYNFADPLIVPAGVSNAYTANWANSVFVVDTDGQASATDCSASEAAFSTVQSAINAAGPGDTVKVCPGTYNESPDINKSLTLQSTGGRDVTTIQLLPSGSPGTGYLSGVYINSATANVILDGFTIAGNDAASPVLANSNVVIQTANSVTVTNSRLKVGAIDGGSNGDDGIGIITTYASGAGPVSVTNNEFMPVNASAARAFYINPATGNTFSFQNNQVTGHFVYNAATECGGPISNNTVTGTGASGGFGASNFGGPPCGDPGPFTNNSVTGAATGIRIRGANNTVLTGNSFTGNGIGIWFDTDTVTGTVAHFNRIANNTTAGIKNDTASVLDAENNWWGCSYGPGASGAGCPVAANNITGPGAANVDANPWLVMTTTPPTANTTVGVAIDVYTNLWKNSAGGTPTGGFVRDGTPTLWETDFGSLTPQLVTTSGQTGTFISSATPGVANVSTTIDGQKVTRPVYIAANAGCVAVSIPSNIPTLRNVPVTVPINVDSLSGRNVLGYKTTITYDSTKLTYTGNANSGTLSSDFTVAADTSTPGTVILFAYGTVALSGSGTLLNLLFTASPGPISATPTPVSFSFSFNEGDPCASTTNGSVKIISGDITGRVTYALNGSNGVPNATMSAAGSVNVSTNTDYTVGTPATWGNYTLTGFGAGTYVVTPSKAPQPLATSNGITPLDSSCIAQWGVGQACSAGSVPAPGTPRFRAADVTRNGTLSPLDAAYIAQFSVGTTPVAPNNYAGTWEFIASNTSYTAAQVETGMSGQDYTAILLGDVTGNWNPALFGGARPALADNYLFESRNALTATVPGITALHEDLFESGDAIKATAPDIKVAAGSSVIVPIEIQDLEGKGVTAYQFDLIYDPKVVEPQSVATDIAGTISDGMNVVSNSPEPGLLKVAVYGVAPVNGQGVLVKLRFTAVGEVGSRTPLKLEGLMLNEGGIKVKLTDGQLTIAATPQGTIRGKVLTELGIGIAGARVVVTSTTGEKHTVISGAFGYYEFGALQLSETYTITVGHKRYAFVPLSVVIAQDLTSQDMIAKP